MQAHVYPCTAVTPVNNFRLIFFLKHRDDFNRVCWSRKNFRRYYISIYIPRSTGTCKTLHTRVQNLAGVHANKKKTHKFSCWSGRDAGQTSRTWRNNAGLYFLVYARKQSNGMSKHCIRKFAIMCNITGDTIGRKFTQYIDLSGVYFVKKGIHARNRTWNTNYSWKIIKLFHIILERRELTVCCNQQWDRTEIRNARNVLSLFFNILSKMMHYSDQLTVFIFKRNKVKFWCFEIKME